MRTIATAALCAALAGCAGAPMLFGPSVAAGTPRDQVIAQLGRPTADIRTPDGERLQYSSQPAGQTAWMVDLDPSGRVVRVTQALNTRNFERIQPGWTRADVEREFGPPAFIERVASWNGPIMTYRWRDDIGSAMFYSVYLDAQGVVHRAHPSMEYINAPDRTPF